MKKIDENLLRKIGEAGTNNASKALSSMTGRSVEIKTISTKFIQIEQIPQFYEPEKVVTVVYLPITGDINGCSLLVCNLSKRLLQQWSAESLSLNT